MGILNYRMEGMGGGFALSTQAPSYLGERQDFDLVCLETKGQPVQIYQNKGDIILID